jgi:DNA mismatch endonuclease (patch repair protein)
VDTVDTATRKRIMAAVPQKNSKPEVVLRKQLFRQGLRYRLNVKKLPGSPDVVLPKHRVAIFIHGCFWHRHQGCKLASIPTTRQDFWKNKFRENVSRDKRALEQLKTLGWRTAVVWQCEVEKSQLQVVRKLLRLIKS